MQSELYQPPDLRALIEAEHEVLLRLRKRQYALEALVREIERVTRGETFDIHNDIRWVQMLDYRDKNIIDLASWAKGAYSKGGFLGQLQCHHLRSFGPERAWGNDDDMRGDNYDKTFSEARARLFPGCDGRKLQSTDFEALTTAFKAHSEPLMQDRHQNRAHIYEKNSAGTAKMLDHDESRRYFEYFQGVLNDLALVAFGAKWSLHDMNIMSSEADAQDLVDQLILTRQGRRKIDRGEIERDALYDALHADPHDRDGKPAFNSAKAIFNVLAKRGLVKPLSD